MALNEVGETTCRFLGVCLGSRLPDHKYGVQWRSVTILLHGHLLGLRICIG